MGYNNVQGNEWIVCKLEKQPIETQLMVDKGKYAVLVLEGNISNILGSGEHSLKGFNFSEIYFVNTDMSHVASWEIESLEVLGMKSDIKMNLRLSGRTIIRIVDVVAVINKLLASSLDIDVMKANDLNDIFLPKVKSAITEVIIKNDIPASELSSCLMSISREAKSKIEELLYAYGLKLDQFLINSIDCREEKLTMVENSMTHQDVRI